MEVVREQDAGLYRMRATACGKHHDRRRSAAPYSAIWHAASCKSDSTIASMLVARRLAIATSAARTSHRAFDAARRLTSKPLTPGAADVADDPVPSQPTWSVHELLSSYPRPSISASTFKKLHELSALLPPEEGTKEYDQLKHELEEMVRLVDAVRLVDTSSAVSGADLIPDGRIRAEDEGIVLSSNTRDVEFQDSSTESGTELLKHASRTKNGYYAVEAERRKK